MNGIVSHVKNYTDGDEIVRVRRREKGVHTIEMTFEMCEKLGLPVMKKHGRVNIEGYGDLRLSK